MGWITSADAAELSGYSVENIRKLAASGKVKAQRWGRDWQIDRNSLLAYARKAQESGEKRGPKPAR
jgi:excisionase family DNA binding protein